jgi:hypothetical protein
MLACSYFQFWPDTLYPNKYSDDLTKAMVDVLLP